MTLFRQLSGLGDSGSSLAANSAPGAPLTKATERVQAGEFSGVVAHTTGQHCTEGCECRSAATMGQRCGEGSRTGKGWR
jgi:hypothetical protein